MHVGYVYESATGGHFVSFAQVETVETERYYHILGFGHKVRQAVQANNDRRLVPKDEANLHDTHAAAVEYLRVIWDKKLIDNLAEHKLICDVRKSIGEKP